DHEANRGILDLAFREHELEERLVDAFELHLDRDRLGVTGMVAKVKLATFITVDGIQVERLSTGSHPGHHEAEPTLAVGVGQEPLAFDGHASSSTLDRITSSTAASSIATG